MFNVCLQCGLYRADKIIDVSNAVAICPECGYQHTFQRLPLLIISGASGTGKTTVCNSLMGHFQHAVLLDSDILWQAEFTQSDNNYRNYFETWLRVCKNISQSGRPVVLFGAGMGTPANIEFCIERRYFSTIHYLALTCDHKSLCQRLQQRPAWRGTKDPSYIQKHIRYNQWFIEYKETGNQPPISLLDTSNQSFEETIISVESWIQDIVFPH